MPDMSGLAMLTVDYEKYVRECERKNEKAMGFLKYIYECFRGTLA